MDSPANPTKPREQDAETISRNLIQQPNMEEEVSAASETHSVTEKIQILESVSDVGKSQEAEEVNGRDQKLEVSIEEDETDTMVAADSQTTDSSFNCRGGELNRKKGNSKQQEEKSTEKLKVEDSLIKSPEEDTPREQSRVEDIQGRDVDLKVNNDIAVVNLSMFDGTSDSKKEKCVEEPLIELNLGQETVYEMADEEEHHHEEQPVDLEENKKEEGEKLLWNEDRHAGSHFLPGCDVGGTVGDEWIKTEGHRQMGEYEALEDVAEEDIEEDGEKHEGGFLLFPNGETLHGVAQENRMLGDTSPLGYSSGLQIHGNSTSDFLASRAGMHMVPGSSNFGNGNKREIDHENDISYHFDNPATKRLKTDGPSWDDKPVPFEVCMEQIKQLADKAKLSYIKKDQACGETNMRQQMLLNELQRMDEIIQQLHKSTYEEQQRKDVEVYKLENELGMMKSVLAWYRKALKETQKACRKHKKCCPLPDEPLYKDVKGSGRLVLSSADTEKLRLKQEEEEGMRRALIERQVEEFGSLWIKEYEVNLNKKVDVLEEKLTGFQNKVKLLKKTVSRRQILDTPERIDSTSDN